ncbi:Immunoglobulin G-binding protein A, partial [Ophiophagus hannah]
MPLTKITTAFRFSEGVRKLCQSSIRCVRDDQNEMSPLIRGLMVLSSLLDGKPLTRGTKRASIRERKAKKKPLLCIRKFTKIKSDIAKSGWVSGIFAPGGSRAPSGIPPWWRGPKFAKAGPCNSHKYESVAKHLNFDYVTTGRPLQQPEGGKWGRREGRKEGRRKVVRKRYRLKGGREEGRKERKGRKEGRREGRRKVVRKRYRLKGGREEGRKEGKEGGKEGGKEESGEEEIQDERRKGGRKEGKEGKEGGKEGGKKEGADHSDSLNDLAKKVLKCSVSYLSAILLSTGNSDPPPLWS